MSTSAAEQAQYVRYEDVAAFLDFQISEQELRNRCITQEYIAENWNGTHGGVNWFGAYNSLVTRLGHALGRIQQLEPLAERWMRREHGGREEDLEQRVQELQATVTLLEEARIKDGQRQASARDSIVRLRARLGERREQLTKLDAEVAAVRYELRMSQAKTEGILEALGVLGTGRIGKGEAGQGE